MGSLLSLFVATSLVYPLSKWIYNIFFHPLKHIPGPRLAAVSSLWMTWQDVRFRQARAVHELFETYGPVVRIAPNKVAFLDVPSIRSVYAGRFPKSIFYKCLMTNENDHAMTVLESTLHTPRKRAYAPHYTPLHLSSFQPEMRRYTGQLLSKLSAYEGKRAFDCRILFKRLMVDILFCVAYDQHIDALKQWDITNHSLDSVDDIIQAIDLFPIRGVVRASIPTFIWPYITLIPIKSWQDLVQSDARIASHVIAARDAAIASDFKPKDQNSPDDQGGRLSLLHRLLRQPLSAKEVDRLSSADIISEAMGHTIAAVDTTSTVFSYAFYALSNHPQVLRRLREEIDPLFPQEGRGPLSGFGEADIPDISVLNTLPYLAAFIKETLRLHGSAPSLLERVVPHSAGPDFSIAGVRIPPGTIVATQSWSTHRQEDVFPQPKQFDPDRWLHETRDMSASTIPFGTGTRICGGMNLAQVVLRIVITAVVRNFDVITPPETTPACMEMQFAFVLRPAGGKVNLVFVPRNY